MDISPEFATELLAYAKEKGLRLFVNSGIVTFENLETHRQQVYADRTSLHVLMHGRGRTWRPHLPPLKRPGRGGGQPRIHTGPPKKQTQRRREYLREVGRKET